MSIYYVTNNAASAREFFEKRSIYLAEAVDPRYANLVDFNFAEKHLYGRVTRTFEPMVINRDFAQLRAISGPTPQGAPIVALQYVADAFAQLSQQFRKSVMANKIDPTDDYLSELSAVKAFEDPQTLYRTHLNEYQQTIASLFIQANSKISNFDQFIVQLMTYFKNSVRKHPFTYPAFIKSSYCPATVSGLVIEIAELNPSNDADKIDLFYKSNNWEFYLNACREYGFMVDRLIPWRIVADIGSAQMVDFATTYGRDSTDAILKIDYKTAYRDYMSNFKTALLSLYNMVTDRPIYEDSLCANGNIKMNIINPTKYTLMEFDALYGQMFFLRLYCKIRFYEEESKFTEGEKSVLIGRCENLAYIDFNTAINAFERILNKTFDYNRSLSYIIKAQKEIEDSESSSQMSY